MKEHLERILQTVQETQLVERLMAARSLAERIKICNDANGTPEFQEFMCYEEEAAECMTADDEGLISTDEFTCDPSNAVEIATVLIVCGIDDMEVFGNEGYWYFIEALKNVEDVRQYVAHELVRFLEEEQHLISECSLEEILAEIF